MAVSGRARLIRPRSRGEFLAPQIEAPLNLQPKIGAVQGGARGSLIRGVTSSSPKGMRRLHMTLLFIINGEAVFQNRYAIKDGIQCPVARPGGDMCP